MSKREEFQSLLRSLFEFDRADLDFGIYRVMNLKSKLIDEKLIKGIDEIVDAELSQLIGRARSARKKDLDAARDKITAAFGKDALDARGNLRDNKKTPLGREYAEAKARAEAVAATAGAQIEIYNHLLQFFSRYYADGDFVSQKRASSRGTYALSHNGEEVRLHWANRGQYYIKNADRFAAYGFRAGDCRARFAVREARDLPRDDSKESDKRHYFPLVDRARFCEEDGFVEIPFDFRAAVAADGLEEKDIQSQINRRATQAAEGVFPPWARDLLAELGGKESPFARHLDRYTRGNLADFFVHKNLREFLSRELDFYLKSEVLRLDEVAKTDLTRADSQISVALAVRAVALQAIEFLSQFEDFQKTLWEKRKFVTATEFIVRAGLVGEKLRRAVVVCEKQWIEWRDKLAVLGDKAGALFGNAKSKARKEFLDAHPSLPVDTANFEGGSFKDDLLASFEDIDGICDGVMIHGDNFQALNLLASKYRKRVKCAYADPPYNTAASEILYKNGYKHSSWMTMMENRISAVIPLISRDGVLCVAIDDEEMFRLKMLTDGILREENFVSTLVFESNPRGRTIDAFFATCHDYVLVYAADSENARIKPMELTLEQRESFDKEDDVSKYRLLPFRRSGGLSTPEERRHSYYPIFYDPLEGRIEISPFLGATEIYPVDSKGKKRVWRLTKPSFVAAVERGDIVIKSSKDKYVVSMKDRIKNGRKPKTVFKNPLYDASSHGTVLLTNILGEKIFPYPKSIHASKDTLKFFDDDDFLVIDFFAGSGTTAHAAIDLNREDGGRRKFILAEMGEHFDTVLLPRVKKIVFTPEWRDGKPDPRHSLTQDEIDRAPRLLKYCRIESYEDALDNIEFSGDAAPLPFDDYEARYMLQWESKECATFANGARLNSPFSYSLRRAGAQKMAIADLPETFNYLVGLRLCRRRVLSRGKRRYLVDRGVLRGKQTAVVWRDTSGWKAADYKADRDFVAGIDLTQGAEVIYTNGDSRIEGAQSLNSIFRKRMFASAG